ncbi:MAG: nucleotide exchange factor GrpE [Rhizomicrobium sp.]|jgi:molecular chaperone GrpE
MNDNDDYMPEQPGADIGAVETEALKNEVADLKDRLLRALADAENTRRRAERDKTDASQYAVTKFARDILAVADNFQRATNALPEDARGALAPQVKSVIEGVEATERQLLATLERYGVKPIETAGAKFDPNLHQAIAEVPGNGQPAGNIVDVVQTGYVIGDRLLRPSMVTVARAGGDAPQSAPPGGSIDTKA